MVVSDRPRHHHRHVLLQHFGIFVVVADGGNFPLEVVVVVGIAVVVVVGMAVVVPVGMTVGLTVRFFVNTEAQLESLGPVEQLKDIINTVDSRLFEPPRGIRI